MRPAHHAMRVTRAAWEDAKNVFRGKTPTHTHLRDRIIAIATFTHIGLQAIAISVVASLAGSFAAFFHRRGRERDAVEAAQGGGG